MNTENFWNVIGNYNKETLVMQLILLPFLLVSMVLAYRGKCISLPKVALGICNLFMGIVFELYFGTEMIQRVFVAPLFIIIGILLIREGIRRDTSPLQKIKGLDVMLFILICSYPLVSLSLGHQFPRMVLYGMPCPMACLTLLFYSKYQKKNRALLILLTIWGFTGVKSLMFDVMEDMILLIFAFYGCCILKKEITRRTLTNRKIFITGGTSGIGLHLAKQLTAKGNQVIVCSRDIEKVNRIKKEFPEIEAVQLDITDTDMEKTFSDMLKQHNGIDMLINNAGIQKRYEWKDAMYDFAKEEINTNFLANVRLIQVFLGQTELQNKAIVNITSMLGVIPKRSSPSYGASKAAMHIYTKSLRYQLSEEKVNVYDVLPPLVETDMSSVQSTQKRMNAEECARQIIEGIEENKLEIMPGKARILLGMHKICPKLFQVIMAHK